MCSARSARGWMRMDASSPNGITMGDASGVGPEILLKAFANGEIRRPFVAYGDMAALQLYNERLGYGVALRAIARPADYQPGDLNVVDHRLLRAAEITRGKLSEKAGTAARECVVSASASGLAGDTATNVT